MFTNFYELKKEGKYFDLCIVVKPHDSSQEPERKIFCHRLLVCRSSNLIDMLVRNGSSDNTIVTSINLETTEQISATDIENTINALYRFKHHKKNINLDIGVLNYLLVEPDIILEILEDTLSSARLNHSEIELVNNLFDLYGLDDTFIPLYQFYYDELDDRLIEAMKDIKYRFGYDLITNKYAIDNICIHLPSKKHGYIRPGEHIGITAFNIRWQLSLNYNDEDGYIFRIAVYDYLPSKTNVRITLVIYYRSGVKVLSGGMSLQYRYDYSFTFDICGPLRYTLMLESLNL